MQKSGDYRNLEWGFGDLGGFQEDDFLIRMSFSGYQMLYETVNLVGNGNVNGSVMDFTGDNVLTGSLPEDPFCMNIRSTLNTISNWLYVNQMDLVSDSHDEPIRVDQKLFERSLDCFSNGNTISELNFNVFAGLGVVILPEDPFCMRVRSTLNTISGWFHENQMDLVSESHDEPTGVADQMCLERMIDPTIISQQQIESTDFDDDAGEPHELVLPYLEMKDILAVEGVCRSLRDSVRKEPFSGETLTSVTPLLRTE